MPRDSSSRGATGTIHQIRDGPATRKDGSDGHRCVGLRPQFRPRPVLRERLCSRARAGRPRHRSTELVDYLAGLSEGNDLGQSETVTGFCPRIRGYRLPLSGCVALSVRRSLPFASTPFRRFRCKTIPCAIVPCLCVSSARLAAVEKYPLHREAAALYDHAISRGGRETG